LLDKKALHKSGDILWDQIIVNVHYHLVDEFYHKLHADGDVLSLEGQIAKFNFVGVDGVLQKGSKILKDWWSLPMKTMGKCVNTYLMLHIQVFVILFLMILMNCKANW
jgi:hypothetical protein